MPDTNSTRCVTLRYSDENKGKACPKTSAILSSMSPGSVLLLHRFADLQAQTNLRIFICPRDPIRRDCLPCADPSSVLLVVKKGIRLEIVLIIPDRVVTTGPESMLITKRWARLIPKATAIPLRFFKYRHLPSWFCAPRTTSRRNGCEQISLVPL